LQILAAAGHRTEAGDVDVHLFGERFQQPGQQFFATLVFGHSTERRIDTTPEREAIRQDLDVQLLALVRACEDGARRR
jgi:hypothetical protein